jgi:hypothetical protein
MIFKPPMNIAKRDTNINHVFLAGSIEMGKAEDWQAEMTGFFNLHDWGVFNPRRDDWDPTWVQDFDNPQFAQQVNWELNALDNADFILMYFAPDTISPISLYEFGRYSESNKMAVVCPKGFWRKGNIEIGCHKDGIPLFDDFNSFKKYFITKFK